MALVGAAPGVGADRLVWGLVAVLLPTPAALGLGLGLLGKVRWAL